jgi:hypothetical protein
MSLLFVREIPAVLFKINQTLILRSCTQTVWPARIFSEPQYVLFWLFTVPRDVNYASSEKDLIHFIDTSSVYFFLKPPTLLISCFAAWKETFCAYLILYILLSLGVIFMCSFHPSLNPWFDFFSTFLRGVLVHCTLMWVFLHNFRLPCSETFALKMSSL